MEKFEIGDLIFYQGRSVISRVIEAWTHSKVSHVGVIYRFVGEQPVVAEALADGFVLHMLAADIANSTGHMWHGRMIYLTTNEQRRLQNWIRDNLGDKYSVAGAIAAGLKSKWLEKLRAQNTLFCSEGATKALQYAIGPVQKGREQHADEKIIRQFEPEFTTPADLYRKSKLWKIK